MLSSVCCLLSSRPFAFPASLFCIPRYEFPWLPVKSTCFSHWPFDSLTSSSLLVSAASATRPAKSNRRPHHYSPNRYSYATRSIHTCSSRATSRRSLNYQNTSTSTNGSLSIVSIRRWLSPSAILLFTHDFLLSISL